MKHVVLHRDDKMYEIYFQYSPGQFQTWGIFGYFTIRNKIFSKISTNKYSEENANNSDF